MLNNSSSLKRHSLSNILVKCKDDKFCNHSQNKNLLTIYHQNICWSSNKINELITLLQSDFLDFPCITKHQFKQAQLECTYLDNYHLGAGYCRQDLRKGGVSIFIHGDLKYCKWIL